MTEWLVIILSGFFAGITASLGLGGGSVLIILLTFLLGVTQTAAQGINLLFFLPVALFSIITYSRRKQIRWRAVLCTAIPGTVGAAAGALISGYVPEEILRKIFGAVLIVIGVAEIVSSLRDSEKTKK